MSSSGTPAAGDTGAAAAAAAAAAASGANKPWYDGADADIIGSLQVRGWDKLTPAAAALEASKAHRAAEKLIGAPANELLRMPKDTADAEGWQRFNDRVGVPKEAKEYDFSAVKFKDGSVLDQPFVDALAPALQKAHVSKADAAEVVKAVVSFMDNAEVSDAADTEAALNTERETLKINWGPALTSNLLVAKQTAATLGVKPEAVAALEKVVGYAKVMEMFRDIGTRIGEDKFITNDVGGSARPMSQEAATATLAERQNDVAWVNKLLAGDALTLKEFNQLTQVKAGRAA